MQPETPAHHGMKAKTIKTIIRRKVDAWLESITDKLLREKVGKSVIVTGGSIASMLLGDKVSDFDIYLRDHDTTLAVTRYYLAKFTSRKQKGIDVKLSISDEDGRIRIIAKSAGVAGVEGTTKPYHYFEGRPDGEGGDYVQDVIQNPVEIEDVFQETEEKALNTTNKDAGSKYRPIFLTSNAITLSDKLQIIIRFYGEPNVIHENFDFVHCTNYWMSWNDTLVLHPEALESLLSRELRYSGSKYPICTLIRVRKFVGRGWRINAGQLLKMAMQISQLDLTSVDVLEDQLTGVDTAYFMQLIDRMKEKDQNKIDSAYLVEIIDRIF